MSLHETLLLFVFVASVGMEVYACVCYVGDEASSIKGEPPLKLLPDQNPCECTEFRPGGVNTKRQAKPREVTFGNDGHPEGWTHKDCIKEAATPSRQQLDGDKSETTPSDTMPHCGPWSITNDVWLNIPPLGESFQSFPVILEFTLQGSTTDVVHIISYDHKIKDMCTVDLDATIQDFQDAFDGSTHYLINITKYKLVFGRMGDREYLIECATDDIIDNISIWSESALTVAFFGTCPNAQINYW